MGSPQQSAPYTSGPVHVPSRTSPIIFSFITSPERVAEAAVRAGPVLAAMRSREPAMAGGR